MIKIICISILLILLIGYVIYKYKSSFKETLVSSKKDKTSNLTTNTKTCNWETTVKTYQNLFDSLLKEATEQKALIDKLETMLDDNTTKEDAGQYNKIYECLNYYYKLINKQLEKESQEKNARAQGASDNLKDKQRTAAASLQKLN
jgi:hypothetical protein